MTEKEWSQFAGAKGLDPNTGTKQPEQEQEQETRRDEICFAALTGAIRDIKLKLEHTQVVFTLIFAAVAIVWAFWR